MAFEHKPNTGSLFINDNKKSDNHPDEEGKLYLECPHCQGSFWGYIKAWVKKTRDNKEFRSMAFKAMSDDGAQKSSGGGRPNYGNRGGGQPSQGGGYNRQQAPRDDQGYDDRGYDDRGDHQRPAGGGYRR